MPIFTQTLGFIAEKEKMVKLKFETENSKHGLSQARGFAWLTQEGIQFEYQVLDTILEVIKSDPTDAFVPFSDIQEIKYEKSWLSGDSVIIEVNSMKKTTDIPFLEETSICLELDRKQKESGKNFAVDAQLALANYRNNQLDNF